MHIPELFSYCDRAPIQKPHGARICIYRAFSGRDRAAIMTEENNNAGNRFRLYFYHRHDFFGDSCVDSVYAESHIKRSERDQEISFLREEL